METTKAQGSLLFQLFCIFITSQVTSQKHPTFIKKASNPILGFKGEALNFTWIYSNHSSKRIYFGIWNKNYGLVDPSLLTVNIFPNLSLTLHPNIREFSAKPYIGRVKWVGDATQQVASFELSPIKDSDAKHYGIEVDFHDNNHDTISSWSTLIVKPPSVFTFGPNKISCERGQMANFTWKYSLNDIDMNGLNLIRFGLYKDGFYKEQCNIQVEKGMVRKSSCSSSRAHLSSIIAYSKVVFVLRNVNLQDEAIYAIRLGGIKRATESKTMLFVTDHPKITINPQSKTITEGRQLNLTCFTSGKPQPTITWYKDGRVVKTNSNEMLIVNKTKRTDDGTYRCVAANKVGRASSFDARVEVYYAPSINISSSTKNVHVPIRDGITLKCPAIANPKAKYKWIVDGRVKHDQVSENLRVTITSEEDYKKYTCKAMNIIGEDNATFVLLQVGPPSTPRVDCDKREDTTKSRTAKFHWNAPEDNGGAPILTYHVKYRTVMGHVRRGPWKYANVSRTETWYRLELEWGKTFEVTVTAWNIYGMSPMDTENTCAVTVGKNPDLREQLPRTTPKLEAVVNLEKPESKSPAFFAVYVGPFIGLIVLIAAIVLILRRRKARKKLVKTNWTEQHMSFNAMEIEGNFWEPPTSSEKLFRSGIHSLPRKQAMVGSPCYQMDPAWKIPNEKICVLKVIGNGAFGLVYKGRVRCTEEDNTGWKLVAIKSPYADATDAEIKDLMKEFELLKTLKPHPHVIKLLGCGEKEGRPLVIIEYVPFGDLLGYLRKSRGENDDYYSDPEIKPNTNLSSQQLLRFGWHVADGMAYLASQKIIHRDLAARNVLVGEGLSCKITDFGMAKDVSGDDIYVRTTEGRLPVKWTAIEALTGSGEYTTQSDVWSFGVVLYEICTIGSDPYPGIVGKEIPKCLESGYRMTRPRHVDPEVYEVMACCWKTNPDDRPTFPELRETLIKLEEVESRDYINLDECLYQNVNQTNAIISGTSTGILGCEKEGVNRGTLKISNDYHIGPRKYVPVVAV